MTETLHGRKKADFTTLSNVGAHNYQDRLYASLRGRIAIDKTSNFAVLSFRFVILNFGHWYLFDI
jgi:hypothetical protein